MNKKTIVILAVIGLIIVAAGGLAFATANAPKPPPPTVTLRCAGGSEKYNLSQSQDFQETLEKDGQVRMEFVKMGTIQQVILTDDKLKEFDCLWPSSDLAFELLKAIHNEKLTGYDSGELTFKSERIFQTALDMYATKDFPDALVKHGDVYQGPDGNMYLKDPKKFFTYTMDGTTFDDLGYSTGGQNRRFFIETSDPRDSNSGNMHWTMVVPSVMAGEFPLSSPELLAKVAPDIVNTFVGTPYQYSSTGTVFDSYLSNPLKKGIFIAYDFEWVESPAAGQSNLVRIYLNPSMMSVHPLIIIQKKTDTPEVAAAKLRLLETMFTDPEIHRIALQEHGFLTANPNVRSQISDYDQIAKNVGVNISVSLMPVPQPKIGMIMTALLMQPDLLAQFTTDPASMTYQRVLEVYANYAQNGGFWQ